MSFKSLPKDIVQYLSKYIDETPKAWKVFKIAFDNSNQAMQQKKVEVLNQDAWIEVCFDLDWDGVSFKKILLEKPTITTRFNDQPMWNEKYVYTQVKVKDVVNHYNKNKYKKAKVLASRDEEEYECYVKTH